MASVDLISWSSLTLTDIRVVREFQDVFLEVLPRVPPERGSEFAIDLVPGTLSMLKTPYRMAFAELKDLKAQ